MKEKEGGRTTGSREADARQKKKKGRRSRSRR